MPPGLGTQPRISNWQDEFGVQREGHLLWSLELHQASILDILRLMSVVSASFTGIISETRCLVKFCVFACLRMMIWLFFNFVGGYLVGRCVSNIFCQSVIVKTFSSFSGTSCFSSSWAWWHSFTFRSFPWQHCMTARTWVTTVSLYLHMRLLFCISSVQPDHDQELVMYQPSWALRCFSIEFALI